MSIQLSLTVYGPELGRALLNDEEELAYALKEMAGDAPADMARLGRDVGDHLYGDDRDSVVAFLLGLAGAIEAAE